MKPVVLAILDGWGIGKKDATNPIHVVNPQNINYIKRNFLSGSLQASGIAVGLPWNEEGNSEVGHLTMGAGKIVYQHYPRISTAIQNESFFQNEVLLKAIEHSKINNSALNLIGLITEGNIHASLEHILALIKLAQSNGAPKINLHFFSDGKDSDPKSVLKLLAKINLPIATISGRYYALDRDRHWDRTEKVYNCLVGNGPAIAKLENHIQKYYDKGLTDEFVEPAAIGTDPAINAIQDNDSIIFFDFREDSIRQIAESFINPNFKNFPIKNFTNLFIATMTNYSDAFKVPVAFPSEIIKRPIGKIISEAGKTQLRIAETEKYAHLTYFFNGLKDQPMENEFRVLVPSRNVPRHDEYPEMMASEITSRALQAIEGGGFDFILINYANPDVIAHTGNFEASLKAVEVIDAQIGKLTAAILQQNGALIITSDHGNIERMLNPLTWMPETMHDTSPVPVYIVGHQFKTHVKNDTEIDYLEKNTTGILSDITPTILELLELPEPPEMTGKSLIKLLR